MFFKKHKSSKDVPPAKTQRIEPPSKQPKVTVNEYGTREFHNMPKKSHPKPSRNQYENGSYGSIDNNELDILLKDNPITNTPVKLGKILETIQTGSNSESLIAAMELLEICKEREKEWQEDNKKDATKYHILVTRDEYLLNFIKRFGGNEEKAIESFNNISKGYNFVLAIDENHFYSVDYINKLLER